MDAVVTKRKISIRLDEELLDMLERVSRERKGLYFDRDRTWLIEHAIKAQYAPIANDDETDSGGNSPSA